MKELGVVKSTLYPTDARKVEEKELKHGTMGIWVKKEIGWNEEMDIEGWLENKKEYKKDGKSIS